MLHGEDEELQIRLVELQLDAQIYLAICFGFLAAFMTLIIGFEQIFFTLSSEQSLEKAVFSILISTASVACIFFVTHYAKKIQVARKQLEELKKQHVW